MKNIPINDILDREISCFDNVFDTEPKPITLRRFLYELSEQHKDRVELVRGKDDKRERDTIKHRLPHATISGSFGSRRQTDDLVSHSGLICIDIDQGDNTDYPEFDRLKENLLCNIKEIAYAAHSVGGRGYFAIIPLAYPNQHLRQFRQLQKDFSDLGIVVDNACSDITRMRCLSYDPDPVVNDEVTPYVGMSQPPAAPARKAHQMSKPLKITAKDGKKLYWCINSIYFYGIDLTANYQDWIEIGFSLASIGEEGRNLFHEVSSMNPNYDERETDYKFDSFLRSPCRSTLATFFHHCYLHGIK